MLDEMAHGVLREFDPHKESIEDFQEHFNFYCLANKISGEEEAACHKQASSGSGNICKIKDFSKSDTSCWIKSRCILWDITGL